MLVASERGGVAMSKTSWEAVRFPDCMKSDALIPKVWSDMEDMRFVKSRTSW
jgi:hypothetical protein